MYLCTMEFAANEVRPRRRAVCVHSFFDPKALAILGGTRMLAEKDCLNAKGDTVIEKIKQIPSKTKMNS